MKYVSTPNDCKKNKMVTSKETRVQTPSNQTLTFIMQFAKSYHVEKKLPLELSGLSLN